jgi:hypothetical protein
MLARKSLRIVRESTFPTGSDLGRFYSILMNIKYLKHDYGGETKILFDDILREAILAQRIDGKMVAMTNECFAHFYHVIVHTSSSSFEKN